MSRRRSIVPSRPPQLWAGPECCRILVVVKGDNDDRSGGSHKNGKAVDGQANGW